MSAGASSLALQRALHRALTGDADLMAVLTGVHDAVPPDARYPYATIGDDVVTDWSTKTGAGHEHRIRVTVWDDAAGASRLKTAISLVEAAVARLPLAAEGYAFTGLRFVRASVARDALVASHAVAEFSVRSVGP